MKLAFGVLSSRNAVEAIEQICRSVAPHQVVVHHDFSQKQDFELHAENAHLIHDFVRTSWGAWSQTEAILKVVEYTHDNLEFDYFQLLSDSCLPIRPIGDFENYLAINRPDACMEVVETGGASEVGLVCYAWRYYARSPFEQKWMRRLRRLILGWRDEGKRPLSLHMKYAGLSQPPMPPGGIVQANAQQALRMLVNRSRSKLPGACNNIFCGSTWICVGRHVMPIILDYKKANPDFVSHFKANALNPDEAFLQTVIGNQSHLKILPLNHFLRWEQRTSGPDELTEYDFEEVIASGKFFARKFPKSPDDKLRRMILDAVC